jgi:hypothetical protein
MQIFKVIGWSGASEVCTGVSIFRKIYRIFRKKGLRFFDKFDKFDKNVSFIRVTFCKHLGYRFCSQLRYFRMRQLIVKLQSKLVIKVASEFPASEVAGGHTLLKLADL